jgi:putative transposase
VAEKYNMYVIAVEVAEEHVHLCVEIPPHLSVGAAVRMYKSLSARYLVKRFPHLNRYFWGGPMWSPSYFARTAGEGVTAEMVRKYIETHDEGTELGPVQAELFRKGKVKSEAQDLEAPGLCPISANLFGMGKTCAPVTPVSC